MLDRLHHIIARWSRANIIWILGIATALFMIAYNVIVLPDWVAQQLGYTGSQRLFAIDLQFNYSPDWVYTTLANYGEKGRETYGYMSLLFDYIFPVIYSLFLATSLTALFSRLWPQRKGWQMLGLLGLLPGTFDWLENIGILNLLISYPKQLPLLVNVTNVFTITKYSLTLLCLIVIIGGWFVLNFSRKKAVNTITKNS